MNTKALNHNEEPNIATIYIEWSNHPALSYCSRSRGADRAFSFQMINKFLNVSRSLDWEFETIETKLTFVWGKYEYSWVYKIEPSEKANTIASMKKSLLKALDHYAKHYPEADASYYKKLLYILKII